MDNSDLEKLKKRLYEKDEGFEKRFERQEISRPEEKIKSYWQGKAKEGKSARELLGSMKRRKRTPFLLIFSLLLLVLLALGSIFYLLVIRGGNNVVSSKNIEINTDGPSTINAGREGMWHISVTNNNKIALELADLIVEYPENSLSSDGAELSRERRAIGRILPGETAREELDAFLLGEEETREINITLEYRTEGSNAIFAKTVSHLIKLSGPAVAISLDLPKETESGQQTSINIEYVSNSDIVLKDLVFKMEYPPGFQYQTADLEPIRGNDTWQIGDLAPQEERNLEIKGILEGPDLTEIGFRALIAIENEKGELNPIGSVGASTLLKRSFINFDFRINNSDIDTVSSGTSLVVSIPWKNNLPVEIRNAEIRVKLVGDAIDYHSISVNQGFYRGQDNTVVWNSSSLPMLKVIAPASGGTASFSFRIKETLPVKTFDDKNFIFNLEGEIEGTKIITGVQNVVVKSTVAKQVKIASKVQLASRALYYSGPFVNSGLLPPKVGQETTYTIIWSITNFYNDVGSITIRASLPSYIRWLGAVNPSDESIHYNAQTAELVWQMERVEAGTGILRPAKEVAFQIGFLPAFNQVGQSPSLISQSFLEARDLFTDLVLHDIKASLSTDLTNEPGFDSNLGKVVE